MLSFALLLCSVDAAILRAAPVTARVAPPRCVATATSFDTDAFDKVVMKTCARLWPSSYPRPSFRSAPVVVELVSDRGVW